MIQCVIIFTCKESPNVSPPPNASTQTFKPPINDTQGLKRLTLLDGAF